MASITDFDTGSSTIQSRAPIYAYLTKIARSDFGCELPAKEAYSLRDRIVGFLTLVPPIYLFITPFNAAGAAVLSVAGYPSWKLCLVGFITAAFAAGGVNIFNRYADRQRDKTIWPWRAIPTGRVKAGNALALSIVLYIGALLFCWLFFNPTSFFILLAAIILGSLYSSYLRDKVGYLSLPPIVGLVYLGGWAAFSPETLFASWLPWYLYFLGFTWQAAHIMIHYVLHIEHDADGKIVFQTPAFFCKPSARTAINIGIGFTVATFLLSISLPLFAPLGVLYLVLVLATGIFTLNRALSFLKDSQNHEKGHKAWGSLSMFRLVISAAILLGVFVYQF